MVCERSRALYARKPRERRARSRRTGGTLASCARRSELQRTRLLMQHERGQNTEWTPLALVS